MPAAAATVSLLDGQATPVATVFTCLAADPGLTIYRLLGTVPALQREFTVSTPIPTSATKVRKSDYRTNVPYTDSLGVVKVIRLRTVADFPIDAPQAAVDDAYAYHANGLDNAQTKGAVKDGLAIR